MLSAMNTANHIKPKILVVDDVKLNISILQNILKAEYEVQEALCGEEALRFSASDDPPDIILLDIMMPEMDGFEVCKHLKSNPETQEIPVIFLSGLDDTQNKVKGLSLGAVDYILKPFQPAEVFARVETHITLNRLKKHLAEKNEALKSANDYLEERVKERTAELTQLNRAYERFVPRQFLSLLNKKSILDINLGDQVKKKMTVMFSDVREWTTLAEKMSPQENFYFINAYLKRVSPIINQHNGFIDQFYGDGVMALFPESPNDALNAAIEMQAAVNRYNEERKLDGFIPIEIGTGIHMGELMLGIIGSRDRMQGSVVADAVNLASRLEGLTRTYGSSVTLSESTLLQLKNKNNYQYRFVDIVKVKGKKKAVSVYEIFSGDSVHTAEVKQNTKSIFEEGLRLYYGRQFSEASVRFSRVLEKNSQDKAVRIYLERCAEYMIKGVPDGWTGLEGSSA